MSNNRGTKSSLKSDKVPPKTPPPLSPRQPKRKLSDPDTPSAKRAKLIGAVTEKPKPWRLYFTGPENVKSNRQTHNWYSPTKWFSDEILAQVFAESLHNDSPCQFGFFLDEKRWFGVHLSLRSEIPIQYSWRIANLSTHGNIPPGPLLDVIQRYAKEDTDFAKPSTFWKANGNFRKDLIAIKEDVPKRDKTGYEDVRLIRDFQVDVPEWLQRCYRAHKKWCLPKGLALGSVVSLGILLEVAAANKDLEDVQRAVNKLNNLTIRGNAVEQKLKRAEEKKAEDALFAILSKDPAVQVSRQRQVIFPHSENLGRIDLLISAPKKIIIELKLAKFWPEAIGQIKRYQASVLQENESSLSGYEMHIFLVNCSKKDGECEELEQARQIFPFAQWKINFVCNDCKNEPFDNSLSQLLWQNQKN